MKNQLCFVYLIVLSFATTLAAFGQQQDSTDAVKSVAPVDVAGVKISDADSLARTRSTVASESKTEAPVSKVGGAEKKTPAAATTVAPEKYSPAISDNSFLIEEAYNQEAGVMQTISTCNWYRRPQGDVFCTVTQEFPAPGQKHQLSYTLPFTSLSSGREKGVGDIVLNYRYQLTGESAALTMSPRVSLILATGNFRRGLGTGGSGLQFNLPMSKRLSEKFAMHLNAGGTFLRGATGFDGDGREIKRSLNSYNLGGSIIWLARKKFNLVFEYLENFTAEIGDSGAASRFNEKIVNPGTRFAIDIGPLQIVPGVSFPTSFAKGGRRTGVFFYLSFEHPFKKVGR